jgi:hypothetical protein
MKKSIIFILLLLVGFSVQSQILVTGIVKDNKGKPIKLASITLIDTYDGATSDSLGKFSFKTYDKGEYAISASLIGYRTQTIKILLEKDTAIANFILKDDITELDAVTITAGSFEANDKKRATVLNPLDIVTTAGAGADISSALQTLPGAQRVGEQEGLFIRGGSAEESKIIIDGAVVNNFFFSSVPGIQQRGRFSPFLFSSTAFSTGGYSALYGQALSAVLNLESIDIPDASEVQFGISPIFTTAGFQRVSKSKKASFGMSYSYTNLALYMKLIPQGPDFFRPPTSHNLDANFRMKTFKNGMVKVYGYLNTSRLGLKNNSFDSIGLYNQFKLNNVNCFFNVSWKQPLGKGWKLFAVTSYSNNVDNISGEVQDKDYNRIPVTGIAALDNGSFDIDAYKTMLQFRTVVEKKIKGLNAIRFGGETWRNEDRSNFSFYYADFKTFVPETYSAGFVESDIFISKKLAFRPGLRYEYSALTQKANIAPRGSISYLLAKPTQISFDYGIFYQTPDRKYLTQQSNFDFTRADHYILTFQHFTKDYTFRAQVFDKEYRNLLKTDSTNQFAVNTDGYGYARGIEIFWRDKKTIKGLDYWISYSYLDTKRDYLNFPIYAQPNFAANNTGSIVIKKFWSKKMFGINWSYNWATGRPYYNPNKPSEQYLSDRTKFYSTNNFSFNWITKVMKSNAVFVVGVNNVFNQKQVFGYTYSSRIKDDAGLFLKQAVGPPASMGFFVGLFMSWGVDRTQQSINNNL